MYGGDDMGNIDSLLYSGTIQTNIKNTELKMKFEQRKETQAKTNPFDDEISKFQDDNKMTSIDSKLKTGVELTEKEMEYLKEKSPELYKKAIAVKEEKNQYRQSLKNSRSKEEAERIRSSKMQAFLSEAGSIKNNPTLSSSKKEELLEQLNRRIASISREHLEFKHSIDYQKLPNEKKIKSKKINLKA